MRLLNLDAAGDFAEFLFQAELTARLDVISFNTLYAAESAEKAGDRLVFMNMLARF